MPDVPADIDANAGNAVPRSLVVVTTSGSTARLSILPVDGSGFGPACLDQQIPESYRGLAIHPSLPVVYGVKSGFEQLSVGCGGLDAVNHGAWGAPRPIQQIVIDSAAKVGFFSIDGSGSIGVHRFALGSGGTPTVTGGANTASIPGPLALDEADQRLFAAGPGTVDELALAGTTLDLPTSSTSATGCAKPTGLVFNADSLFLMCSDSDDVLRYSISPLTAQGSAGSPGAFAYAARLPGARIVGTTVDSPALKLVDVGSGSATWTDGPSLPGPPTALAASGDGKVVVTARQVDPSSSELALWGIESQTIAPVDSLTISGTVVSVLVARALD